jgi:hypothetical protein
MFLQGDLLMGGKRLSEATCQAAGGEISRQATTSTCPAHANTKE